MYRFVAGLDLARQFYEDAVRPLVGELPHSAALIGPGSEVLGFDTARSTDHDWGPRLLLFLRPADRAAHGTRLDDLFARRLPDTFAGYPVRLATTSDRTVRHRVVSTDLRTWFDAWLGFDPRRAVTLLDWLATPTQRLAEVTGGAVFHDGLGELDPARERLRWYPDDVWRYVVACQWQRIGEEEAFAGRCAEVGDEVGAAVVTARLARDLMRLYLLLHKRFPPYSKWLGTALHRLPGADVLAVPLARALSTTGAAREEQLCRAYTAAAGAGNATGLTGPVDPTTRPYYDRPFQVLDAGRFSRALLAAITDPAVAALPGVGAIDQFADSTALLGSMARCRAVTRAALAPVAG